MTRGSTDRAIGSLYRWEMICICILLLGYMEVLPQQEYPLKTLHLKINRADSLADKEKFKQAIQQLDAIYDLINERSDPDLLATYYSKLGHYTSMDGQDKASIPLFHKAIQYAKQANDQLVESDALNNLGVAIGYIGHPDSAFYYLEKSLKIRETLGDTTRLAATYRNMAEVLRVLRRLDEAGNYCRKAYRMIPGISNFRIIVNIYNETAYLHELDHQLDSAAFFYQKLIEISKRHDFIRGQAVGYSNLASIYQREKKYREALKLLMLGLQLDQNVGNQYGIMTSYHAIANCYNEMKEFKRALQYLDSATVLCDSSWAADLQGLEYSKYLAFKGLGNYRQALTHFEYSTILNDSIFNEKKRKNIAEILTRYETEKKEQQIEILNKTNELQERRNRVQLLILIVVVLISFSGAFISWLIIKNKNQRIHQMNLELRNYLLQLKEYIDNDSGSADSLYRLKTEFGITQREAEILELISKGLTNAELGKKLFVSENTIKYHIKNIYLKLDVKNRVQALRKAHMEEV
ncbi:MAG: LuxR family transcriptional regulator [Bacteroidetes bacterium]|nr:LuxR family transcriptional regulator [Bacteroidota bacterium]